jgi:hypothetical protein
MARIEVYVQEPNEPKSAVLMGLVDDSLSPQVVSSQVGIHAERFFSGKIVKGRKGRSPLWPLVAELPPQIVEPIRLEALIAEIGQCKARVARRARQACDFCQFAVGCGRPGQ